MYARVGTVMGFPNPKKWVVTLQLEHTNVKLGMIAATETGEYRCESEKNISYDIHDTLVDAAYRLVWTMADNNVHIYFSHACVQWAMQHDEYDDVHYKGIANV